METNPGSNKAVRERDRKHLTVQQRRLIAEHLDEVKGHVCAKVGPDCRGNLLLDHIDDDPQNNVLKNFQWLCRHHNQTKRTLASKSVRMREIERKTASAVDPADNLVSVSARMQADLDAWLFKKLGPGGPHRYLPERTVEKEAGHDCSISPVTIRRYLVNPGPMTASNARWRLVDRTMIGDPPGKKTLCVMWRGYPVDDDEEALSAVVTQ